MVALPGAPVPPGIRWDDPAPPVTTHRSTPAMEQRRLGKTGRDVSVIGFGAWAIGGSWGTVDDEDSLRALHAAADSGVTLIDTADVYRRMTRSERPGERFFVPTKI